MQRGLLVASIMLLCAIGSATAQDISVMLQGPIKTLAQARDAARALRRVGKTGPIRITVHAGTYYLPETLVLGPEDSNTVWEAAPGEHPVISGGRVISGWTKASGNVWTANAQGNYFHQLFVNDRRATRTRMPDDGFFRIDGESSQSNPFELHFHGDDIKKAWADSGDVEAVVLLAWADLRMPIVKVDTQNHVATLAADPQKSNLETTARYFIENVPDALDGPGKWYLDRRRDMVTYFPWDGENMERSVVVAPSLIRLVSIRGDTRTGELVRNVVFRGLTFEHAAWDEGAKGYADGQAASPAPSAIEATGAENLLIDHCTVAHSGGYAIHLGRGSQHNAVTASEIYDMGAGGIKIGEPAIAAQKEDRNYDNEIANNQIHDLGQVYTAGVGIWVLQSENNRIVHNHVHDLYNTAISVGWTWGYGPNQSKDNMIAFNDLHDIGKGMLSDMGGIYTLGVQSGTVIRNNLIHDVWAFTYGGWGIYLDEGSSDILAEDNIVYHCKSAGFHQNYGQDNIMRNNIFAFNHDYELMRTRSEPHKSYTFEANIIYFDQGGLLGSNWTSKWQGGEYAFRNNLYYDKRGPQISFAGKSLSEWQSSGMDKNSTIANPLFVDADNYNFHLRDGSPALKMGFHQIDTSRIGPTTRAGANAW